jgi:hypothetical protein
VCTVGGYLFSTASSPSVYNHTLKFRLLDHLWENFVVEKLRVKIILPELSRLIFLWLKFFLNLISN